MNTTLHRTKNRLRGLVFIIFSLFIGAPLLAQPALIGNINAGSASSSPAGIVNIAGTVYFAANDGTNGIELWKSNGTTLTMVKDINPSGSSSPNNLININGLLYFGADDGTHGTELWVSDGTSAGTVLTTDINPGSASSSPNNMANAGGLLFFSGDDGSHGKELWKSDGTSAGTVMVKDIMPGINPSDPNNPVNLNGVLYFKAGDPTNGAELYMSDGTLAGTSLVKDINPGTGGSFPAKLINVNGTLFFRADNGINGAELWTSDGTGAGTAMLKDINPGSTAGIALAATYFIAVNGKAFFQASDGSNGFELWVSDGTLGGTSMVKDIYAGGSSSPSVFTDVNGTLFFTANDGSNGIELWKSDGTSGGTSLVKDIYTGAGSSSISSPAVLNNTLYFAADNGSAGSELWMSDGTSGGTSIVLDINSGATGSLPAGLTNGNGTLFFSANDGSNGIELWKYVITAPTPALASSGTLSSFSTTVGTPSAAQSFSVSGSNLTANIVVTAPAQFEVSLSSSTGFGTSVNLIPASGTVASTSVYVRYNPGASGTHNGNVNITSTNASSLTVLANGSSSVASISAAIPVRSLSVFPNPVQDKKLTLSFESSQEISSVVEIMNQTGQILISMPLQITPGGNQFDITTQTLSAGMYYIRIRGTAVLEKIVIQ